VLERLERGGPMRALSFTVAAWFRYLTGTDDRGQELPINDPIAEELTRRARAGGEDPRLLLGMRELFGDVLPSSPAFVSQVEEHLRSLFRQGPRSALARCLAG
jgi:mannitol 2-dehydrogenase